MEADDLLSDDFRRGYISGNNARALYAHARLGLVASFIQNEMKSLFELTKTENNTQEEK